MARTNLQLVGLTLLALALISIAFMLGFEPNRPLPASTAPGSLVLAASMGIASYVVGSLFLKRMNRYEKRLAAERGSATVIAFFVNPEVLHKPSQLAGVRVRLPSRAQLLILESSWEIRARGAYRPVSIDKADVKSAHLHPITNHRVARTAITANIKGIETPLTLPVAAVNGEVRAIALDDLEYRTDV